MPLCSHRRIRSNIFSRSRARWDMDSALQQNKPSRKSQPTRSCSGAYGGHVPTGGVGLAGGGVCVGAVFEEPIPPQNFREFHDVFPINPAGLHETYCLCLVCQEVIEFESGVVFDEGFLEDLDEAFAFHGPLFPTNVGWTPQGLKISGFKRSHLREAYITTRPAFLPNSFCALCFFFFFIRS
jgi:hypothetical protein